MIYGGTRYVYITGNILVKEGYLQTSNMCRSLVGNKIVDHSDVVGEALTGDAQTTSSFSTQHLASID